MPSWKNWICLLLVVSVVQSCKHESPLFILKSEKVAPFLNELTYTEEFNPYTYRNFYNGGGVALGDINNDGLVDIYYTGNLVDNKMYLNKGNWEFEDVTEITGLACSNVWSSGANFVDVNGDGLLDLYVCKAGKPGGINRHNELFINKGDLQFEEQSAQYGLNITGLSIQSAFFDYDRDGDLDCYLLNNSLKSIGGLDLVKDRRTIPSKNGNKFLENRDGVFIDVTQESGIYSSEIGFGLGITLSDFNLDGWTDIYVSNDFFEKDYLYINNQDKTFSEQGETYFECFPLGSMGADIADLDNDLLPDLMITEMLPHSTSRKKTKAIYESWKKYSVAQSSGYYHQFPRNMLQRNMGEAGFLEIGRKSGVEATDWSWSCLMQDFDNDGLKDIFVANGIYKDLLDRDYLAFEANETAIRQKLKDKKAITSLIDAMPSQALTNFAFKNIGNFNFENTTQAWGFGQESFSNGCAYGDLDNDGDLDLVINNANMPSFVFENTSEKSGNNYLKLNLNGKEGNSKAIGAKAIVYACSQHFMSEQFPSRGFQSSVANTLVFGLGNCTSIDSLQVIWPDGKITTHTDITINTTLELSQDKAYNVATTRPDNSFTSFQYSDLALTHQQPKFNQFNRERLLMKMNAIDGPVLATADINQDGREDIFMGGGKGQAAVLLISEGATTYTKTLLDGTTRSEVTEAAFFDCDNDGDLDLYIANGGTAFSPYAAELHDKLFINDGLGNFELKKEAITFSKPITTGALAVADYNGDGYQDILIGDRNANNLYGLPGSLYLYKNNGNQTFESVDIPEFKDLGIITDARWLSVDGDNLPDLIVLGEWMPITIFVNTGNGFEQQPMGLEQSRGMWNCVLVHDFNKDGKDDIFAGNTGKNSALTTQHKLFLNDFDRNGSLELILGEQIGEKTFISLDMDELMSQLPSLKRKFIYYRDFSTATIDEVFETEKLKESRILDLDVLESQLYFQGNGQFELQSLPEELQFSSIHAALVYDYDGDGTEELVVGGNHYLVKPQYGREDASKGWLVKPSINTDNELQFVKAVPMNIRGQIRDFEIWDEQDLLIGVVNQSVKVLRQNKIIN